MTEKRFTHVDVYLDLETLPSTDNFNVEFDKPEPTIDDVPEHKSLKDPAKIEKYKEDKLASLIDGWSKDKEKAKESVEKEWRSEALKTYKGRILCIAYALGDGNVKCIDFENGEKEMLIEFYNDIKPYKTVSFIGHNVVEFDLLFLFHRALHYRLFGLANILRTDNGYSKNRDWDTMNLSSGGLVWKYKISLDNLCQLLGVESPKDGIDGSKVSDFYYAGKLDKVKEYCIADVRSMRECFYILKP